MNDLRVWPNPYSVIINTFGVHLTPPISRGYGKFGQEADSRPRGTYVIFFSIPFHRSFHLSMSAVQKLVHSTLRHQKYFTLGQCFLQNIYWSFDLKRKKTLPLFGTSLCCTDSRNDNYGNHFGVLGIEKGFKLNYNSFCVISGINFNWKDDKNSSNRSGFFKYHIWYSGWPGI